MKLGKALIGNSAQKVIDGFFVRFGAAMGADGDAACRRAAGRSQCRADF